VILIMTNSLMPLLQVNLCQKNLPTTMESLTIKTMARRTLNNRQNGRFYGSSICQILFAKAASAL
jgi:hypothetical protein